jgi:hypothetical protein
MEENKEQRYPLIEQYRKSRALQPAGSQGEQNPASPGSNIVPSAQSSPEEHLTENVQEEAAQSKKEPRMTYREY